MCNKNQGYYGSQIETAQPEAVARILIWCGPSHHQKPPMTARTYDEISKEDVEKSRFWKEGAELYTAQPASARGLDREKLATELRAIRKALTTGHFELGDIIDRIERGEFDA